VTTVLILGSAPGVLAARTWPRASVSRIVVINNAWQVRPDWDDLIHAHDFPPERLPAALAPGQRFVTENSFVPAMNAFGGFVYGGGTMAFTAGYWLLSALAPRVIAYAGCDMVYPSAGRTHFYGRGAADPLRPDVTLQSLEAKSARLMVLAAQQGTAVVNLSTAPTRLVFPRARLAELTDVSPAPFDRAAADRALRLEDRLGYVVPSGRYWDEAARFDPAWLRRIDRLWQAAARPLACRAERGAIRASA
jgi:hypothetical protein